MNEQFSNPSSTEGAPDVQLTLQDLAMLQDLAARRCHAEGGPAPVSPAKDPYPLAVKMCKERGWRPAGWAKSSLGSALLMFDGGAQLWAIGPIWGEGSVTIGGRRWVLQTVEPHVHLVAPAGAVDARELLESVPTLSFVMLLPDLDRDRQLNSHEGIPLSRPAEARAEFPQGFDGYRGG